MTERKDYDEKSSDELRADIAQTRARLAGDVEAIGAKLSPENIKYEAKQALREKVHAGTTRVRYGMSNAGNSFAQSARSNPVPVALIGLGLGWLIWDAKKRASSSYRAEPMKGGMYGRDYYGSQYQYGPEYDEYGVGYYDEDYYGQQAGAAERFPGEPRGKVEQVKERMHGMAEGAKERAHEIGERAHDLSDRARIRAMQLRGDARERAMYMRSRAKQQAIWARNEASHMLHENPLAVGAVAIAAGIGVGLLLPSTEREDQLLGQRRDQLFDKVKERAQEVGQVASQTARRAAEAAKETAKQTARSEAEQRGLTSQKQQPGQASLGADDVTVREVKQVGESWPRPTPQSGQNGRSV